jgi:hypothetical protein
VLLSSIEDLVVLNHTDIEVDYNITVKSGGELFLNSSTLILNSSSMRCGIKVEAGAKLTLMDSRISALKKGDEQNPDLTIYGYNLEVSGTFRMENSSISHSGYTNVPRDSDQSVSGDTRKWAFNGIELEEMEGYIINSKIENNTNFIVANSSFTIINSTVINNLNGFSFFQTALTIENCNFIDNFLGLYVLDTKQYQILNSTIQYTTVPSSYDLPAGIFIVNSTGDIDNCDFDGYIQSLIFRETDYLGANWPLSVEDFNTNRVRNCRFYNVIEGIYARNTVLVLTNLTIELEEKDPHFLEGDKSYSVTGTFVDLTAENIIIDNYSFGISLAYSKLKITNSSISNADGAISIEGSWYYTEYLGIEANNLTLKNNNIGISMSGRCKLSDSILDSNNVGFINYGSESVLENNRITNSTEWGVLSWVTEIEFIGDNFPIPPNHPAAEPTNGYGNLAQLRNFNVLVRDTYNNTLGNIVLKIENKCYPYVRDQLGLYSNFDNKTDMSGSANIGALMEYIIKRGLEREVCGDYLITASIVQEGKAVFEKTMHLNVGTFPTTAIEFILELPNLYLVDGDLELSANRVKPGEKLSIKTFVHYNGSDEFSVPDIDVSLYISSVLIQTVQAKGLSKTNSSVEVEFIWEAETLVPNPKNIEKRFIEIRVEPPEYLEYKEGTTKYTDDNRIVGHVEVNLEGVRETPWSYSSSSLFALIAFLALIVIGIIFIIFGLVQLSRKRRLQKQVEEPTMDKKKDEEEEKEE